MKINILISETMMANKPDSIKYSSGTGEFSSGTDVPGWLRVALSVHFTSNYLTNVGEHFEFDPFEMVQIDYL